MKLRRLVLLLVTLTASFASAADPKLSRVEQTPEGLGADVAKVLDPKGYQLSGNKGAIVELWLAKEVSVKDGFKPSLAQLYPFQAGQLVGALRVPKGADFTDFRNQQMKPGVYTLRFGLQPADGNHVGTSETSDFLLALPGMTDTSADPIKPDALAKASAKASGATHPAIFSLVDSKTASAEPKLEKQGSENFVLSLTVSGKNKDGVVPVKLRLIVIGHAEG